VEHLFLVEVEQLLLAALQQLAHELEWVELLHERRE
jgi:hypothetical protein